MIIVILLFAIVFVFVEQYCRRKGKSLLEIIHPSWFSRVNEFPYKSFPCKINCPAYERTVKQGYEVMKTKKVVFAGLLQNAMQILPDLVKRFDYIKSFFAECHLVIFENDSKDNTREFITAWAKKSPNVHIVICPENIECRLREVSAVQHGTFTQKRMQKMANFRNRLLYHIREKFSTFDCVAFMDLDIRGPISMDGMAHSFGCYDRWDTISAYGINGIALSAGVPMYYDFIAYKDSNLDMNENKLDAIGIGLKTCLLPVGHDLVKVTSAFAGLAFYKMNVIMQCNYTPIDNNYVCEHVIFHQNMIRHGFDRIFINPNMLVLVGLQGDYKRLPLH
jgi:hypothetical protein